MTRWLRRVRARVRYWRFDDELKRELEVHRAMAEEAWRRAGCTPDEARARAGREIGNVAIAREDVRRVWIAPWLESLWQDVHYAFRALRKSPGFTATVLLILSAGIGLNVSLFSMFNVLLLRPWDVRDPGSVVLLFTKPAGMRDAVNAVPLAEFHYVREHSRTLAGVVAWEFGGAPLYGGSGPEAAGVRLLGVSAEYFDVLGIDMAQGRGFRLDENVWGAPAPVVVMSHALWQRVFGGDPSLIGRPVRMGFDELPVTIVGITRRGFAGANPGLRIDAFVPLSLIDRIDDPPREQDPVRRIVSVAGRLKAGVSPAAAAAELDALDHRFRASLSLDGSGLMVASTRPLDQPESTAEQRLPGLKMEEIVPTFSTLGAALLLVLLLACANVGNLQLARMLSRRQEIAVRLSLGAGRRRVVRQLLTESTCLGMTAGLMGLGLAWIVPPVFLTVVGVGESASRFVPDGTVLVFTIGLAVGTSFIFALAPALQVTRDGTPLVVWARTGIDARGRRLRSLLLASQIALSLTLLTAGGLLTRGIFHAYRMDFGFDAQDTAYAFLSVPDELRSQREAIWTALDAALERSSVWAAWADEVPPLWGHCMCVQVRRPDEDASWDRQVYNRPLSSAGFDLLGLQFVEGGPHADRPELRQAVINETLARTLFGEETAVGRTLMAKPPGADADSAPYTITGVVRDTHYTSPLGTEPLLHTAPEISRSFLLFRTDRPGATSQLQAIVRAVDSRIRTTSAPVTSQIDRMIEELRLALGLIWAIGLIGLTLAAVGVFGVFSYAVEERRREIGIRLALGARGQDVLHAMFAVNRWSVGGGVAVGLLFSLAVGAVLRRYLFGLSPLDPAAYLAMTTLLLLAALAATLLPLRRAIRIDPATTLRGE